jgi:hypothetical protein
MLLLLAWGWNAAALVEVVSLSYGGPHGVSYMWARSPQQEWHYPALGPFLDTAVHNTKEWYPATAAMQMRSPGQAGRQAGKQAGRRHMRPPDHMAGTWSPCLANVALRE